MGVTAAETSAILVPSFFSVTSSGITEFDYMGGKKKKKAFGEDCSVFKLLL